MKTLKKTLLALAVMAGALSGVAHAATYSGLISGNVGQSIPLFGSSPNSEPSNSARINLDTMETDTGKYYYDLVAKPVVSLTDTVGWIHLACKDSVGTDSIGVRVVWQGNPRSDGGGVWSAMDSVTASASSATAFTAIPPKAVVNSTGFASIRFMIRNILRFSVAQKMTCTSVVLNRRERLTP